MSKPSLSFAPLQHARRGVANLGNWLSNLLQPLLPIAPWRPHLVITVLIFLTFITGMRVIKFNLPPYAPDPGLCVGIPIPWIICLGYPAEHAWYIPGPIFRIEVLLGLLVLFVLMFAYGYFGAVNRSKVDKIDATRIVVSLGAWMSILWTLWTTW